MKAATGFIVVVLWCRGASADCTMSAAGECEEDESFKDDEISSLQISAAKIKKHSHTNVEEELSWKTVICPFLANMVKHGFLKIKPKYTAEELFNLTVKNGLPKKFVKAHNEDNFGPLPTKETNIFDLEGIATEHTTSTGINDCPSLYPKSAEHKDACPIDSVTGAPKCPTPNKNCLTPALKEKKFKRYIELVDVNPQDGILTVPESLAIEKAYENETNDHNLGIQGGIGEKPTLVGIAFMALTMVFGESCDWISLARFRKVVMDKVLPDDFVFPKRNRCDPFKYLDH